MRPLLAMIRANLKMSVRNRTALFWNLAFPAIFILIFGSVFGNDDGVSFDIGIAGDPSPLHDGVLAAMRAATDSFSVDQGTEAHELDALEDGDRDLVLVFGPPVSSGQPGVRIVYDATDGPNAQIALSVARQIILQVASGGSGADGPVAIEEASVSSEDISYIDFFVPGILAMSLMNSGVIGLSTAFVTYRERGILRRMKVTPFPISSFILARVLSQVIVAIAQSIILILLAWVVFDLEIRGNPLLIGSVIVLGALAFLAIGFAISGFARNTETAASYANLVTFPMLFLSGVFFGIDSAPGWLQPITRVLPLSYLVAALREPMTRGRGLGAIWPDLLVLLATFLIAMTIAIRFFRWEGRGT